VSAHARSSVASRAAPRHQSVTSAATLSFPRVTLPLVPMVCRRIFARSKIDRFGWRSVVNYSNCAVN